VNDTAAVANANNSPEGERKTITVLFADIKGSTELMRELDPEEARAIVDPVLQLMMDAVHRYSGYVAQSTGDGIFAMFGAPVAHEDHPQRALHAALTIQQELRKNSERLKSQARPPVEARIGVNTGEIVLRMVNTGGHTEYSPVGHPVNLASRMQTLAPAGSIIITEECRRLVEGYFSLRELGPAEIKGLSAPVNVYEVTGTGSLRDHFAIAASRGLTKFVGRERELADLQRALDLAMGARGQIVAVVAEAGVGKSRLFYEFKARLPAGCKVLEAYSVSHGRASAWLPVLELLRTYFGIVDADDSSARRERVRSALDATPGGVLSYLFALLGLEHATEPVDQIDGPVKKQRMVEAVARVVLSESLKRPLIVVFDDLHWIDEETQAFLNHLVDAIPNARVLLLVNYRPEYRHQWEQPRALRPTPPRSAGTGERRRSAVGVGGR
jgi:class 3 adenylate cyclase